MAEVLSLFQRAPAPQMVGPRLYLRPPHRRDQKQWIDIRRASRDFLVPWEPAWLADATTRTAFRRRLERFTADWRDGISYAMFAFSRETDELLGGITLGNLRRGVAQSGSVGYWIGECHAGRGHMSEALALMLDFAFEMLSLHRVEAACLPHNVASRRVLEKTGFQQEGLARKYLCIDSRWQDHVTYAILRTDPRPRLRVF